LNRSKKVALILGPAVFLLMVLVAPPAGLAPPAWSTAAVGALMCIWWVTEAIPIPATSLLPLVLIPILGAADMATVAAP